jgi:hypothetical protein
LKRKSRRSLDLTGKPCGSRMWIRWLSSAEVRPWSTYSIISSLYQLKWRSNPSEFLTIV